MFLRTCKPYPHSVERLARDLGTITVSKALTNQLRDKARYKTKAQKKKLRAEVERRREAGEECLTDDEQFADTDLNVVTKAVSIISMFFFHEVFLDYFEDLMH